jgi:hypothetical protein
MFVTLSHAPGEAQAYFGEALVVIAGVERTAHFMVFDLPHSDDCFVQALPAETTEAFSKAMSAPSSILAVYRLGYSMTTPSWPWPGFWATASGRKHGPFPSYRVITCS